MAQDWLRSILLLEQAEGTNSVGHMVPDGTYDRRYMLTLVSDRIAPQFLQMQRKAVSPQRLCKWLG